MGSKRRQFTGQQKLEIVLEGLQVENVAEFCRRKDIAEAQFYNWKTKLEEQGAEVFKTNSKKDPEKERLKDELEETRETLIEVTKERELLKKKDIRDL